MSGGMGPFGQIGSQHQQHQSQGSHLSSFGSSEYYGDNQRQGFYDSYAQSPGFGGNRNVLGHDDVKGLPTSQHQHQHSQPPSSVIPPSTSQSSQPAAASAQQPYAPPMPYFYPYPQNQYYGSPYNQGYPTPFVKYPAPTPPAMFQHQHQPAKQSDGLSMAAGVQRGFGGYTDDIGYHQPPQQQTQNNHHTPSERQLYGHGQGFLGRGVTAQSGSPEASYRKDSGQGVGVQQQPAGRGVRGQYPQVQGNSEGNFYPYQPSRQYWQ
jgi:hypothetical protein